VPQEDKMPPIDFNGLDSAVHGPLRLGILTILQVDGPQDFTSLKKRLQAHDGSLNLHLGRLEESGYILGKQTLIGLRPKTTYRLQPEGRRALSEYLVSMQRVIDAVEESSQHNPEG
jgi:DNA-binding PadR family transcriptional regulator